MTQTVFDTTHDGATLYAMTRPDGSVLKLVVAGNEGSAWINAGTGLNPRVMKNDGWRMLPVPEPEGEIARAPAAAEPMSVLSAIVWAFVLIGGMWVFSEIALPPNATPVSNDLTEPRVPRDPALPRKGD